MDRPDRDTLGLTELVDQLASGVLITGTDHRVIYANAAMFRMFGGQAPPTDVEGADSRALLEQGKELFRDAEGFVASTLRQEQRAVGVCGAVYDALDGRVFERDYAPLRREGAVVAHIWTYRDVTELHRQRDLLDAIARVHAAFLGGEDSARVFDQLLTVAIHHTQSAYGFIGDVVHTPDGEPTLRTHALSNVSWNEESAALYEKARHDGLIFARLDGLYGAVLRTGYPVLSNEPQNDPRAMGVPTGHPPLRSFLGVPLKKGDDFVGMIGLANRPGGYDDAVMRGAEPLFATITSILASMRASRLAADAERANR